MGHPCGRQTKARCDVGEASPASIHPRNPTHAPEGPRQRWDDEDGSMASGAGRAERWKEAGDSRVCAQVTPQPDCRPGFWPRQSLDFLSGCFPICPPRPPGVDSARQDGRAGRWSEGRCGREPSTCASALDRGSDLQYGYSKERSTIERDAMYRRRGRRGRRRTSIGQRKLVWQSVRINRRRNQDHMASNQGSGRPDIVPGMRTSI